MARSHGTSRLRTAIDDAYPRRSGSAHHSTAWAFLARIKLHHLWLTERVLVYERPPLGTPTPGQALASYPGSVSTIARLAEVGTIPMIFTTAEFGADAKLDVAALGLATKHN